MKYASVCSGVEAASLAWMPLGWEAAWFSEIEPFPCAVLKDRFPNVPNLGDMTKIKVENLDNGDQRFYGDGGAECIVPRGIDLLVGGTPCQDLSVAGQRKGFDGERSVLALDFVRLAYESKSKWFVWENVPGVFSSNGGRDFASLLSLFTGCEITAPDGGFCNAGFVCNARRDRYGVAWRVLDAQFTRVSGFPFAIPQRRRRVFVVGYFGDWRRAAQVLLEPNRVCWDTPPRIKTRERVAGNAETITNAADTIRMRAGKPGGGKGALVSKGVSLTLGCENDQTVVVSLAGGQVAECAAATTEVSQTLSRNNGGFSYIAKVESKEIDCLTPGETQTNRIYGTDAAYPALNANEGGGQNRQAVLCRATQQANAETMENCAPTITEAAGTSGNNQPILCYDARGNGDGNTACTITGDHPNRVTDYTPVAVALAENTIGRQPQNGGNGTGAQKELAYTQNATGVMGVATNATVRRLLPIETERLMGFPDDWTRIIVKRYKHKPTSKRFEQAPENFAELENGEWVEYAADSVRYKACGNSMCVNVMRWIGMRIEIAERKAAGNEE